MVDLILSGNLIINDKKEIYLLFRKKHAHYETPGGKVKLELCKDPENPSEEELRQNAERELFEEVKGIKLISMKYFDGMKVQLSDGRKVIAHKFITKIEGNPEPNEDLFDEEKSKWIPLNELTKYNISQTIKPLINKIISLE